MDKRMMRWASSWSWSVRFPLEELFPFAFAFAVTRVELLFATHHLFFMMSIICTVSLWMYGLGLRWLILVRSSMRLILWGDRLLWSLLILADLVVIVGNLVNEECFPLMFSRSHSTRLLVGWAWTNGEVGWLH